MKKQEILEKLQNFIHYATDNEINRRVDFSLTNNTDENYDTVNEFSNDFLNAYPVIDTKDEYIISMIRLLAVDDDGEDADKLFFFRKIKEWDNIDFDFTFTSGSGLTKFIKIDKEYINRW